MRHENNVLIIQRGSKVLPLLNNNSMLVVCLLGPIVEVFLDSVQECLDLFCEAVKGDAGLYASIATSGKDLLLFHIFGSELQSYRNALQFPVVELVSWGVGVPSICLDTDASLRQSFSNILNTFENLDSSLFSGLCGETAGDNDHLVLGYSRRDNKALVVSMYHGHDANDAGGKTPGVLPDEEFLSFFRVAFFPRWVFDRNAEHLGEVLTKAVGCRSLNSTPSGGDVPLTGGGEEASGELLLLSLTAFDGWDGEEFRVNARVPFENLENFFFSVFLGNMCCVAFLPEEFAGAEERLRVLKFPADDRIPLIQFEGEISVAADPFCVVGVHDSLGGWADGDVLFEGSIAAGK